MAGVFAKDSAVQEQIDATVENSMKVSYPNTENPRIAALAGDARSTLMHLSARFRLPGAGVGVTTAMVRRQPSIRWRVG